MRGKEGKDEEARVKLPKINMYFDQQNSLQPKTSRCVMTIMKPLRILQFVRINLVNFIQP